MEEQFPRKIEYSGRDLIRDILIYIRNYRRSFWLGTFLGALASSVWLIIPWAIGEIISFAAEYEQGGDTTEIWWMIGIIAVVTFLYYSSLEIARFLIYNVGEKASIDLQIRTLNHVINLDLHWHEAQSSGSKLKKISRGGGSLNILMRMYVDQAIDSVIPLIGILIVFTALSWELNVILLVFFITHYFLSIRLTDIAKNQSKVVNAREDEFYGMQFEMLNSITTIKTMGFRDRLKQFVISQTTTLLDEISHRIKLFRTRLAILGIHQQLFRLAVITFSVWQVIEGNFEVGLIAQVFFYFGKIETAASRFAKMYHQYIMSLIDLMGVHQILQEKPKVEDAGTLDFPVDWKELQLRNIRFRYHETDVLSEIAFHVRRGEKIGLVGASGEGKTTLFKLMQGLYDDYEGFIGFDGVSLREIRRQSYSQNIGVVLQETELFNFSIRENITLGTVMDLEKKELLQEAIRISRVDEFAIRHNKGLDTLIGEKGIRLSGGEKQRLGLARAIFRQPSILFLDEATSHLDNESEQKIQQALHELFQGITAIVIAHRLSTLRDMDRIYVLKEGQIAEYGDFQTLSRAGGVFQGMLAQGIEVSG